MGRARERGEGRSSRNMRCLCACQLAAYTQIKTRARTAYQGASHSRHRRSRGGAEAARVRLGPVAAADAASDALTDSLRSHAPDALWRSESAPAIRGSSLTPSVRAHGAGLCRPGRCGRERRHGQVGGRERRTRGAHTGAVWMSARRGASSTDSRQRRRGREPAARRPRPLTCSPGGSRARSPCCARPRAWGERSCSRTSRSRRNSCDGLRRIVQGGA
jgi:hypothetical protein